MKNVFIIIMILLGVFGMSLAEDKMDKKNQKGGATFSAVSGSNLDGRTFNLPHDFEGELNIVLVAFWREQQSDINTWLPTARRLSTEFKNVAYYELPTIRKMNSLSQWYINNGMKMGIPDPEARRTTITLYIDKDKFCNDLGIQSQNTIHAFVVKKDGSVLWHETGILSKSKKDALTDFIKNIAATTEDYVAVQGGILD